jgi:hypothetical protein
MYKIKNKMCLLELILITFLTYLFARPIKKKELNYKINFQHNISNYLMSNKIISLQINVLEGVFLLIASLKYLSFETFVLFLYITSYHIILSINSYKIKEHTGFLFLYILITTCQRKL